LVQVRAKITLWLVCNHSGGLAVSQGLTASSFLADRPKGVWRTAASTRSR